MEGGTGVGGVVEEGGEDEGVMPWGPGRVGEGEFGERDGRSEKELSKGGRGEGGKVVGGGEDQGGGRGGE